MLKVAILDDYQNVAQDFVDLKKLSGKYEIEIFNEWFESEEEAIEKLNDFEALIIMRERTKISENLIKNLKKLKYISTSGMRNKAIDLEAAKKKKIMRRRRRSRKTRRMRRRKRGGKWSLKYKRSINCKKPKGFSQKQYCKRVLKRKTKKNRRK